MLLLEYNHGGVVFSTANSMTHKMCYVPVRAVQWSNLFRLITMNKIMAPTHPILVFRLIMGMHRFDSPSLKMPSGFRLQISGRTKI